MFFQETCYLRTIEAIPQFHHSQSLGKFFVLFHEISFTMKWKRESFFTFNIQNTQHVPPITQESILSIKDDMHYSFEISNIKLKILIIQLYRRLKFGLLV